MNAFNQRSTLIRKSLSEDSNQAEPAEEASNNGAAHDNVGNGDSAACNCPKCRRARIQLIKSTGKLKRLYGRVRQKSPLAFKTRFFPSTKNNYYDQESSRSSSKCATARKNEKTLVDTKFVLNPRKLMYTPSPEASPQESTLSIRSGHRKSEVKCSGQCASNHKLQEPCCVYCRSKMESDKYNSQIGDLLPLESDQFKGSVRSKASKAQVTPRNPRKDQDQGSGRKTTTAILSSTRKPGRIPIFVHSTPNCTYLQDHKPGLPRQNVKVQERPAEEEPPDEELFDQDDDYIEQYNQKKTCQKSCLPSQCQPRPQQYEEKYLSEPSCLLDESTPADHYPDEYDDHDLPPVEDDFESGLNSRHRNIGFGITSRYMTDLQKRIYQAINIYVYRNGVENNVPTLIHIPPSRKKNMKAIMGVVQDRMKYPIGYAKTLYKMDGTLVRHPCELEMYNKYVVASSYQKQFKAVEYGRLKSPLLILGNDSKNVHVKNKKNDYEAWKEQWRSHGPVRYVHEESPARFNVFYDQQPRPTPRIEFITIKKDYPKGGHDSLGNKDSDQSKKAQNQAQTLLQQPPLRYSDNSNKVKTLADYTNSEHKVKASQNGTMKWETPPAQQTILQRLKAANGQTQTKQPTMTMTKGQQNVRGDKWAADPEQDQFFTVKKQAQAYAGQGTRNAETETLDLTEPTSRPDEDFGQSSSQQFPGQAGFGANASFYPNSNSNYSNTSTQAVPSKSYTLTNPTLLSCQGAGHGSNQGPNHVPNQGPTQSQQINFDHWTQPQSDHYKSSVQQTEPSSQHNFQIQYVPYIIPDSSGPNSSGFNNGSGRIDMDSFNMGFNQAKANPDNYDYSKGDSCLDIPEIYIPYTPPTPKPQMGQAQSMSGPRSNVSSQYEGPRSNAQYEIPNCNNHNIFYQHRSWKPAQLSKRNVSIQMGLSKLHADYSSADLSNRALTLSSSSRGRSHQHNSSSTSGIGNSTFVNNNGYQFQSQQPQQLSNHFQSQQPQQLVNQFQSQQLSNSSLSLSSQSPSSTFQALSQQYAGLNPQVVVLVPPPQAQAQAQAQARSSQQQLQPKVMNGGHNGHNSQQQQYYK